ncbi:MAG: DMT family transporter, partial [Microbacteriaceae bacterium]|nr:DMT family transporter [Microbacteriaceae bacterium]
MSTPPPPEHGPRGRTAFAVAATVVAGVLVATQHRLNGELGQRLDDGFTAALISFGSGWLLLMAMLAVSPRGQRGIRTLTTEVRAGRLAPWLLLGGVGGGLLVLSQGLVAGILGVAIFTIATVTGQTISGMLADATGFAGLRRTGVTPQRVIGAVLTLAAVVVAVAPRLGTDVPLATIVLPLVAGIAIGLQQAVNGRVRTESGSALAATTLNFAVGTAALAVVAVVHLAVAGLPDTPPSNPWLYLGGAVGAIFIAIQVVTVTRIGVLLLGLSLVAGQLA